MTLVLTHQCHSISMDSNTPSYIPKVNDYVKWNEISGWVYFVCDDYITIEFAVKDKPDDHVNFHKKVHCCILCFPERYHELEYIKSRDSVV